MLMESDCMNTDHLEYVLTNPRFTYGVKFPTDQLIQYIHDEDPVPSSSYNRYWMGFRFVYRALLVFLNHYQIKTYMAAAFFGLLALLIIQITKNLNGIAAAAFALSMIIVKPYIIAVSVQFSCCFFLAFIGMLLVPWISRNPKYEGLMFAELGMLTMVFDFYTTPIVTFGLPMVYLYLIITEKNEVYAVKRIIKNAVIWFLSYIGMWLMKLLLTEIFTTKSAFRVAFSKVGTWFGVEGFQKEGYIYDPLEAMKCIWEAVTVNGSAGEKIAYILMMIGTVVAVWLFLKGKIDVGAIKRNVALLGIALLPIVWFLATSQPIIIHSWFQYRSIALTFWALGGYASLLLKKSSQEKKNDFISCKMKNFDI